MNLEEPPEPGIAEKVMVVVPDDDKLQHWFTYHKPTSEDVEKYLEIRQMALQFARTVQEHCPDSPDKTTAIRTIREAVMWANASIACAGK